jgi:hypothetical protein
MHRDKVRIPRPGEQLGLAFEPFEDPFLGQQLAPDELHRHLAIEAELPREEDFAHAAFTQPFEQLVAGNLRQARRGRSALMRAQTLRHERSRIQPAQTAGVSGGRCFGGHAKDVSMKAAAAELFFVGLASGVLC